MVTVWATIIVYIIMLAVVGVVTGRNAKGVAALTVGGRNAGAWLSVLSYGAAYFSAVMFVGYAGGTGLKFGLWGVLAGIGNAVIGSWLSWRVLAKRTRSVSQRLKLKTMPQFLSSRYNSSGIKAFSCIVIFIFLIPYSASVYKGLGSIAQVLLNIDDTAFMMIIAGLSILILVLGGYLVQARADFIQGIIMMLGVALLIIFVVRSDKVGGVQGVMDYAKTVQGLPEMNAGKWVTLMATVLMTSFGTWGLPQMISKFFGIRDDKQAKKGIAISTFFGFLVAGGGYFIGSLCHKFYTLNDASVKAMGGQDFIVPYMLKDAKLPEIFLGVTIVLLLAASVSTLCSITLTASSTFSLDFIKNFFKKNMADKNAALLTKILCVLFVLMSYVVANTDTPILDMMSYSWGIISGSFLAPYVLSLYCKFLNKIGAWASILTGFCIAIIPAACKIMVLMGSKGEQITLLSTKGPLYACIAMISSIVVCIAVSLISGGNKQKDKYESFYLNIVEQE